MAVILVVDDDSRVLLLIERVLTDGGHSVMLASTGKQALTLVEATPFDLVITDLVMPDLEGLELIREIRKRSPAPKIIAMSGGGRGSADEYLGLATVFGATETLAKPFTNQQVAEAVSRVLA